MATKANTMNWAGNDIVINRVITGVVKADKGNIKVADAVLPGAVVARRNVINVTTATRTMDPLESGSLVLLNKADGITITLPAATTANLGVMYEFQILTSITSSAAKWSTGTQGTDFFNGQLLTADPDGSPAEATFVVVGNGTDHDNISMNGTTTGGLAGTCFTVTCTAVGKWTVHGFMAASGDTATPFATS